MGALFLCHLIFVPIRELRTTFCPARSPSSEEEEAELVAELIRQHSTWLDLDLNKPADDDEGGGRTADHSRRGGENVDEST